MTRPRPSTVALVVVFVLAFVTWSSLRPETVESSRPVGGATVPSAPSGASPSAEPSVEPSAEPEQPQEPSTGTTPEPTASEPAPDTGSDPSPEPGDGGSGEVPATEPAGGPSPGG